jgi:tripartite-type tricarboxylate transporter receptor subunit TctC
VISRVTFVAGLALTRLITNGFCPYTPPVAKANTLRLTRNGKPAMIMHAFALLAGLWLVAVPAGAQTASTGSGQGYPAKPVRFIVPSTGASELAARIMAQGLTDTLGQQFFVDLRPGAGGNLGAEIASKAPADGYTVVQLIQSHAVNVSLFKTLGYDVVRDFIPVTRMTISPLIVVVHPSLPVKSIAELVKLAKARPGALNYSSAGVGTSTFLGAELFKAVSGIDLVEVRYRGGAAAQTAVLSGETSIYFAPVATALPYVRNGRLRGLAVGTAERLPNLRDYPTVAESGYPGYESSNWHGFAVPAKTPKDIVGILHAAAMTVLKRPDVQKRMQDVGFTPAGEAPEQFAEFLKADIEKWRKVVRQSGIAPQ